MFYKILTKSFKIQVKVEESRSERKSRIYFNNRNCMLIRFVFITTSNNCQLLSTVVSLGKKKQRSFPTVAKMNINDR